MPMGTERPAFIRTQLQFAAHIRDPGQNPPPPGIADRHMAVYRRLIYNNLEGFIASGFPVLRSLYDDARWEAMIRDFLARHRCRSPLFPELYREFLDYLEHERAEQPGDPPFLLELAHYEWVELALYFSDLEPDRVAVDPDGDLLAGVPVLSPLAWPLACSYPVHIISPEHRPQRPGARPTYLVVYRNADGDIGYVEINPPTARLLTLIRDTDPPSGEAALRQVAAELALADPEVAVRGGAQTLAELRGRGILLGTRP
jgi:hypothetical protein